MSLAIPLRRACHARYEVGVVQRQAFAPAVLQDVPFPAVRLIQVCHTGGSGWVELAARHCRSSQPWAAHSELFYIPSVFALPYITVISRLFHHLLSDFAYPSVPAVRQSSLVELQFHLSRCYTRLTAFAPIRSCISARK